MTRSPLLGRSGVWRWARIGAAVVAVPFVLWACTSHPLSPPAPQPEEQTDDYYTVNPIRDVDLLFVIDNSGSTDNKQQNFARNFPNLINALEMLPGGLPSVRIGVVDNDLGAAGAMTDNGCAGHGDGARFLTTDPTGNSCGLAPGAQWLTNNNFLPPHTLADVFSCMATRGSMGCGFEHQLKAADVALNPRPDWNPMNAGFLRPDAYLAIVILTDEDDCSGTDNAGAFFMGAPPPGVAQNSLCAEAGTLCNGAPPPGMPFDVPLSQCQANPTPPPSTLMPVQQLVSDIMKLKPGHPERIVVAAIAGWPTPGQTDPRYTMVNIGGRFGMAAYDVGQVCRQGGGGTPALRIKAFLDAFPNSTLQTICTDSYAPALTAIGNLVGTVVGNPCISAPVVDTNPSTAQLDPDCVVEDIVNGQRTPLPQCSPNGPRPCWSLMPASNCTGSGYQVAIDRAGHTPPMGLQQSIKCRTCATPDPIRCPHP